MSGDSPRSICSTRGSDSNTARRQGLLSLKLRDFARAPAPYGCHVLDGCHQPPHSNHDPNTVFEAGGKQPAGVCARLPKPRERVRFQWRGGGVPALLTQPFVGVRHVQAHLLGRQIIGVDLVYVFPRNQVMAGVERGRSRFVVEDVERKPDQVAAASFRKERDGPDQPGMQRAQLGSRFGDCSQAEPGAGRRASRLFESAS